MPGAERLVIVRDFLGSIAVLLAAMALIAIVESFIPFRKKGGWAGRRLVGNLGMTTTTILLNFAFGAGLVTVSVVLRAKGVGLLTRRSTPLLLVFAVGIVALDLSTYVAHRVMHWSPLLS